MSTTDKQANLSHQAHFQIEAMCFALQNAAMSQDTETLPHLVQALAARIIELNGCLMGLVDGGNPDIEHLNTAVFGALGSNEDVAVTMPCTIFSSVK